MKAAVSASPHQFHVAGPRPAQGHHKDPDLALLPVGPHVAQAAPVHLGLFSRLCLKAHGRYRLATLAPRLRVGQQGAVAPIVALAPNLPPATPRSSPVPLPSAGLCDRRRGPASIPAAVSAWARSPPEQSGTSTPCCGPGPTPEQSPGPNNPDRASRISLSTLHLLSILASTSTLSPWMMLALSRWLNSNLGILAHFKLGDDRCWLNYSSGITR